MDHIKLKLSDMNAQNKLETAFGQLGWSVTGRTISERRDVPPLLRYKLEGDGVPLELYDAIPRFGYGLTLEPMYKVQGRRQTLHITVRQLVPTNTAVQGGLKTFGDGRDE